MRKRSVRTGLRLIAAALLLIIGTSFYHLQVAELFAMEPMAELQMYQLGMFWAALLGGYGVVVMVLGFVQAPLKQEAHIRVLPALLGVCALIFLFFFLVSSTVDAPPREEQRRLRPGETITI